jgi:tRNA U34 2-thiouridine synthase MnmA/TrmU
MNLIQRAKDANKDQTYFIWQIKQEQLPHVLFPVGEFDIKSDVRAFAESKDLITSNKPDSQGLCFVGQTSLREMLLQTLGRKDGFIYTYLTQTQIDQIGLKVTKKTRGQINSLGQFKIQLGDHEGAFLYTIGQRQNLGISNGPWFVAEVDIVNNEVIVCHNQFQESIESKTILVKDLIWHLDIAQSNIYTKSKELSKIELLNLNILPTNNTIKACKTFLTDVYLDNYNIFQLKLKAQIRYRSQAQNCQVYVYVPKFKVTESSPQKILNQSPDDSLRVQSNSNQSFAIIKFDEPIKAAAKGQSIVFYDYDTDQYLIGGGVMETIYKIN